MHGIEGVVFKMNRYEKQSNYNNHGVGFISLLQLLFIGLKLTDYIKWSWLWVLSPTWIGFILFVLLIIIVYWYLHE